MPTVMPRRMILISVRYTWPDKEVTKTKKRNAIPLTPRAIPSMLSIMFNALVTPISQKKVRAISNHANDAGARKGNDTDSTKCTEKFEIIKTKLAKICPVSLGIAESPRASSNNPNKYTITAARIKALVNLSLNRPSSNKSKARHKIRAVPPANGVGIEWSL